MAKYRIISWRGIPTAVKATDERGASVTRQLPPYFQQEVDRVAMAEGITGSDEYLEAWRWSAEAEREGTAEEVAEMLAAELAADWRKAQGRA